jgi:hypothetical protein
MASMDKFSAAGPAAGYLYQARLALAEALRFAYADSGVEIAVERFDDVSFEKNGAPLELLQTKHHLHHAGDLTDASPDLWKTLRIWAERAKKDPSLASRTRFALITTAAAAKGSAASLLRPESASSTRDVDAALNQLSGVMASSESNELQKAFAAFGSLAPEMQRSLLAASDVLDGFPNIVDLEAIIEDRLKMIAPRGKASAARELLEGWWWGRIAKALQEPAVGTIAVLELEARLDDIRELMKRDALPVDMEHADPADAELQAFEEMTFVQQLRFVRLGSARVELAKRDFYRASTQRSRWTRQNLLFDGEVGKFEKTLIEEWQPRYHAMCDDLNASASVDEVCKAGQKLYQWVEGEARFPFRSVIHRFLSVGSYNMLANELRLGWHRDYATSFGKGGSDGDSGT